MTHDDFLRALAHDGSETDAALHAVLQTREMPGLLRESMAYSLFAGGKRLRPALCLETCDMLQGDRSAALHAACALEMIHTYSLIHDDLPAMDNDDMRRGKPSNHVRFGEANAILAGDGLLSLALEMLTAVGSAQVMQAVGQGAFDMVSGQSYDLAATDLGTEDDLLRIHRLKTGALIRASVMAGAYCAAPSEADVRALLSFSESYGLLFQITDDILDATGDVSVVGKSLGKDEAEEKLTFVSCYGLAGAKDRAAAIAEEAAAVLERFGGAAGFFSELTSYTLSRKA